LGGSSIATPCCCARWRSSPSSGASATWPGESAGVARGPAPSPTGCCW
jgi:hypothetical protein